MLTFAGVIQTHLQRVMGMTYMEVQDQIGLFDINVRFRAGVAVVLGALLFIDNSLAALDLFRGDGQAELFL